MTTYVICDNCERKFKSQYQIANLKTNIVTGNIEICHHCGQQTLAENRNMINLWHMGDSEGGSFVYQCPNCSNLQGKPKDHKYNMVKFEDGEIEAKCSNCGAILTRNIIKGLNY